MEVVDVAESRLRQRLLVGLVAQGRAGLGSRTSSGYGKGRKDRRLQFQVEVRAPFEEVRTSRMVGMWQQGSWIRLEGVEESKVTWTEL